MVQFGMNKNNIRVEISYKTIVFSFLFLIGLFVLWHLRSLLALFFVCLILTEALNPIVKKLEAKKVSRTLAIIIIYIAILIFLSVAVASIVPSLVFQINGLVNFLPRAIERLDLWGISTTDISSQLRLLEGLPAGIAKTTISIFSNIFGGIVILMITFYMLLERKDMNNSAEKLLGSQKAGVLIRMVDKIEDRLVGWTKAELFLMIVVGLMSYIGYMILGLDFALALGIMAAVLEIIPNIGPTVTTILAALVALNKSIPTVILTVIWGILVQQLENNLIVPKIMKKQVGMSPIITIFALAVGAKMGGVMGTLLAIPSYLAIETAIKVIIDEKRER